MTTFVLNGLIESAMLVAIGILGLWLYSRHKLRQFDKHQAEEAAHSATQGNSLPSHEVVNHSDKDD